MQVSVESLTDLKRRLTVELPTDDLMRRIDERLDILKAQVSVEGFRPGKVPLDVVRSKYGDQVKEEIFSQAVQESLKQALAQEQLEPVGEPQVEIDSSAPDSLLRFYATLEIMPQVELQPVEQIQLERPVVEIGESDVDQLIDNLRRQRLRWKAAGRPTQAGDRITLDYSGRVNGEPVPGATAQGLQAVIGEGGLLPGFEEQIIGKGEGEACSIQVDLPGTFPAAEFRGKAADFDVTIRTVEAPELPELDEKFFRSFGVHESDPSVFRDQVRQSMQSELDQKILGNLKASLIDQLLEMHKVQVPEMLIQLEIGRLRQLAGDNPESPTGDKDLESQARRRVAGGIIFTEMARKLGIAPTSDMIREKVEQLAQSYENPDEVVAWYYSSQEQLASVEAMVTEGMLIDYVMEHGQVTDRPMSFSEMMNG